MVVANGLGHALNVCMYGPLTILLGQVRIQYDFNMKDNSLLIVYGGYVQYGL